MLIMYVDETLNKQSGLCIVSGYLGNSRAWKKYDKEWRKELGERNSLHLTRLRLNALQAEQRSGDLLARLGAVPARCGLRPFVGSICEHDYRDLVSGTELEIIMEGYVFAIIAMMDKVKRHIPRHERLEVVFEQQTIYAAQRERAMKLWQESPHHTNSFGKSILAKWRSIEKDTRTEASDYLCYALHAREVDQGSQKALLTAPILKQRYWHNHLSAKTVKGWIERTRIERGRPFRPSSREIKEIIRH